MALNVGTLVAFLKADVSRFNRPIASATSSLDTFVKGWLSLKAVQEGFNLAKTGAQFQDAKRIFDATGASLEDFRRVTNGLIDDQTLIEKFNLARSLGVSEDAFKALAQAAIASSRSTGQSVDFLFDSAITGAARQSVQILDNLGITIKKTGDSTKFMNDLIAKANKLVAESGDEALSATGKYDKFIAQTQNLRTSLGILADRVLTNLGAKFSGVFDGIEGDLEGFVGFLQETIEDLGKVLAALGSALVSLVVLPFQAGADAQAFFLEGLESILEVLEEGKQLFGEVFGFDFEPSGALTSVRNTITDLRNLSNDLGKTASQTGTDIALAFEKVADLLDDTGTRVARRLSDAADNLANAADSFDISFGEGRSVLQNPDFFANVNRQRAFERNALFADTGARTGGALLSTQAPALPFQTNGNIGQVLAPVLAGAVTSGLGASSLPGLLANVATKVVEIGVNIVKGFTAAVSDLARGFLQFAAPAQGAIGRVQQGAVAGVLAPIAAVIATTFGTLALAAIAPAIPVFLGITAVAVVLSGGLFALFGALTFVTAGFGVLAGVVVGLSRETESFNIVQQAFTNALTSAAAPLEGFVLRLVALAEVFRIVAEALAALAGDVFAGLPATLFNIFKQLGIIAIQLTLAFNVALTALNAFATALGVGFADTEDLASQNDRLRESLDELTNLTFGEAIIAGIALADLADSANDASDSFQQATRNLPEGFRLQNALFNAQDPANTSGLLGGGASSGPLIAQAQINIFTNDARQFGEALQAELERNNFNNTGNSQAPAVSNLAFPRAN